VGLAVGRPAAGPRKPRNYVRRTATAHCTYPCLFVVLAPAHEPSEELREELKAQVVKFHGKTLRPEDLKFVNAFPKTRSAKIVRKVIRKSYLKEDPGDLSSIENPEAIDEIGKAK